MPEILRAEHGHDFLALVPSLAGFRPRDCVIVVAFRGAHSMGAFRYPLPPGAGRDTSAALASAVVGTLCRIPGADAVAPVIYTRRTFGTGGPPHRHLGELLVARFEAAGFRVRDALVVARDGWGSYFDEELPSGGRPLGLIEESPLHRRAADRAIEDVDALAELPPRDRERSRRLAERRRELARLLGRAAGTDAARAREALEGLDELAVPFDPVDLVELLLDPAYDALPDDDRLDADALLLGQLASPPLRDAAILQLAFGERIGELSLADHARLLDRRELTGESHDEAVAATCDDPVTARLAALYLGRATTRPEVGRVHLAIERLRPLAADAPRSDRPAVLSALAWLAWSLGRGTAAGRFVDRALAVDPGYGLAQVLHALFGSGAIPEWAFAAAGAAADAVLAAEGEAPTGRA